MNKWNNKFRYQVASCWLFILKKNHVQIIIICHELIFLITVYNNDNNDSILQVLVLDSS